MDKKVSSILIGVSGEYFVAGELSRRGYVAAITLRNTRGTDIVVSNEKGTKTVNVQVKTKRPGNPDWILTKKAESVTEKNIIYIFVSLYELDLRPQYYIVPSKDVAKYIKTTYDLWLRTPGKGGRAHKETSIRIWDDQDKKYLERWDLLGLD